VKWNRIIRLAHRGANALSVEEIKMLSEEVMETDIIQKMAEDIFKQINTLPKPEIK
jgi:hypothetical protein